MGMAITTLVYKAASEGIIEAFDTSPEHVFMFTSTGNTVLHINIASMGVSTGFVEKILETYPALLEVANISNGDTPLHVAAKCGHSYVLEVLIKFAENQRHDDARKMLGTTNLENNTAFHEAVRHGNLDAVKTLIKVEPGFPYSTNSSGQTPLYIAAARGNYEMVSEILKKCPSAAYEGPSGKTALHAAVISCSEDTTKEILERKISLLKEGDENGWIPLHYAAYHGLYSISDLLIKADPTTAFIPVNEMEMTALHLAAGQGHVDIVNLIIAHSPESYERVDGRGWNLLHFAVISFNDRQLKSILKSPWSIILLNQKNREGNTPLHLLAALCQNSSYEIVSPYDKGDYQAVNKHNLSVEQIVRCGFSELEQEIIDMSKYVSGQYPACFIKMTRDKRTIDPESTLESGNSYEYVIGIK